jgi:hypothetical protein
MTPVQKILRRLRVVSDQRDRNFYLQRWVGDLSVRERRANKLAARSPRYSGPDALVEDEILRLNQDGNVPLVGVIRPAWLPEMIRYFRAHECFDPYRKHVGMFKAPANVPPDTHVANYKDETVARAPWAFEIANHPTVLCLVARFLGGAPTIALLSAWWSLPRPDGQPEHAEKFHRDIDDYRFIKLFCYLTDVDEDSGPHNFVRGSHRINKHTEPKRRLSDEVVASEFGADNLMRITGPAGTTFLENTYGIHRGIPAAKAPRLVLQVLYSLRPLIYSPRRPFLRFGEAHLPKDLDRYINRVYVY